MTVTRNSQKKDNKKSTKKVVESSDSSDSDTEFIVGDSEDDYETVSESEEASLEESESEESEESPKKPKSKAEIMAANIMKQMFMSDNSTEKKGKEKEKSKGKKKEKETKSETKKKSTSKPSSPKKKSKKMKKHESDAESEADESDADESDGDESESESEAEADESEAESEEDEEYDTEDAEDDEKTPGIILSIDAFGGGGGFHSDEYDYKEMIKEDKNETCDSDDEQTFMKESYVKLDKIVGVESPKKAKNDDKQTKKSKKSKKENTASSDDGDSSIENKKTVDEKYKELSQLKKDLSDQLVKTPKNKILQNAIQECRNSISSLVKKERKKNAESYYKLVHKDEDEKRNTNEISYFKKKLSHKEQVKVMEDLKQINSISNNDKPYRLQLLEANIPPKFKAIVLQKLNVLKMMEPNDSEYYKLKNWGFTYLALLSSCTIIHIYFVLFELKYFRIRIYLKQSTIDSILINFSLI